MWKDDNTDCIELWYVICIKDCWYKNEDKTERLVGK